MEPRIAYERTSDGVNIAVDPSTRRGQFMEQGRLNLLQRILRYDYEHFTQTVGALVFGWGSEEGPRYSTFFRQSVNQDDCLKIYDAMMTTDVTDLLPRIQCPTLVFAGVGETVLRGLEDPVRMYELRWQPKD